MRNILLVIVAIVAPVARTFAAAADHGAAIDLHKDWQLQSSCDVKASAEQVSTVGFDAKAWHRSDMPSTVVAALVADKTYPEPTYGTNLRKFPGFSDDRQHFFSNLDMPKGSPFACSWWFRTEFTLPTDRAGKTNWLHFLGINYRANVWLNGKKIADANDTAGTYVAFEFNVSKALRAGQNALAVEISAPGKNDLGLTWVDWNPTPPDKNMGFWKEIFLTSSGDVSVRNGFVGSKLDSEYKNAALTVSADLRNAADHSVNGILRVELAGTQVSQPVTLGAGESRTILLDPSEFPMLKFQNPALWWPYQMGKPHLYSAKLSFELGNAISDTETVTFGIREVTSELTDRGYRLFKINGRKILIRGAAWAPEMLLRWSSKKLDADLNYVKDMGLNTIRLEGRIDRDELFSQADRLGILIMPGWTCCDAWEQWENWKDDQRRVAAESMRTVARELRNHPSVFVWLYGSDGPPPADVEKMYLGILKDLNWPNPSVSSASATATTVTGESGVKMTGPYEYVPPVYWLADTKAGGAYGYNTETSPGPAIPTKESLERFIPKEHLWPINDFWNFHAGGERFTTIDVFTDGLNRRYGTATTLDDFLRKAQAVTYDGERAMFEAYGRNKYTATGVIQWMLNNAWPSLIWHLYDYYLVPAGGYFGTKKAMEPVHIQYSYDDNSVAVVNSTYETIQNVKVSAKIFDLNASEKGSQQGTMNVAPDSSTKAFDLPKVSDTSKTYFLKLELHDSSGKLLSDNFYWLSTKPDVLDWKNKKDTVYTPQAEFADLTGLNTLPQTKVEVTASKEAQGDRQGLRVSIRNPAKSIAFMVHLRLTKGKGGEDVTPIFWSDNYFSLLPGESKDVTATYGADDLGGKEPILEVDGYNVAPQWPQSPQSH